MENTGSTEDRKFTLLNNTLNAGKIDYSKLTFTSDLTNGLGLYYYKENPVIMIL